MVTYLARDFLQYTTTELWEILTGEFALKFDDGTVIETNYREVLYSSYSWDFHRMFPSAPLLPIHHVKYVLDGARLGSSTHRLLLGNAHWSAADSLPPGVMDHDRMAEMVYELNNLMYNDLTIRLEEYVTSFDILDLLEILDNPKIREIKENCAATPLAIRDAGNKIIGLLSTDKDFDSNPIAQATRSGIANASQVQQVIGPIGVRTDMDSETFPVPIMRGFGEGLRSAHDSLIESRSAAKALKSAGVLLRDAEYFSRRLQLVAQQVAHIARGDCGSTDYVYWKVTKNLEQLEGKYYMDDDGVLKTVGINDYHLLDRTIKMRSVIHCKHPGLNTICTTCFGQLGESVPDGSNIGHQTSTSLTQQSSQAVLSTKHKDGSAVVEGIGRDAVRDRYFKLGRDMNSYHLHESLRNKKFALVIEPTEASSLTDIHLTEDISKLNIRCITEITEIGIRIFLQHGDETVFIPMNQDKRRASMTYTLLSYIKTKGWTYDSQGNIQIDMSDWDWNGESDVFALPLRQFNMSDHAKEIADAIESNMSQMILRDKGVSPDAFLVEFNDLVNSKLKVKLSVSEVVVYSAMVVSAEENDYRLPKTEPKPGLGVMKMTIARRSLSAAMAYEGHFDTFMSPYSYTVTGRPDHPMDAILCPAEVEQHKGKFNSGPIEVKSVFDKGAVFR